MTNHNSGKASTPADMTSNYSQYGGMLHGNNLEINNLN